MSGEGSTHLSVICLAYYLWAAGRVEHLDWFTLSLTLENGTETLASKIWSFISLLLPTPGVTLIVANVLMHNTFSWI